MTREEYLSKLESKLNKHSDDVKSDIISDYIEHFEEGKREGKSDEEIIEELGDIEEMIQEIDEENKSNWKEESQKDEISNSSSFFTSHFSSLVVDTPDLDITLIPYSGEIKADLFDSDDNYYLESHENGDELVLKVKTERKGGFFSFLHSGDGRIEVRLPNGLKRVRATSKSGDISSENLICGELKAKSASGDIKLRDVKIENGLLSSVSGDVSLKSLSFSSLVLSSTSGDVELENAIGKSIDASTVSGDIEVEGEIEETKFTSISGDISLDASSSLKECTAKSTSGDVSIDLFNIIGASIETKSTSGRVYVKGEGVISESNNYYTYGNQEAKISATTISGEVDISIR